MSVLTNDIKKYAENKAVLTAPEKLYEMADSRISAAKARLKGSVRVFNNNQEDLRQDFVTLFTYLEKCKYYKKTKGSIDEFADIVFDMALGKYNTSFNSKHEHVAFSDDARRKFETVIKSRKYAEYIKFSSLYSLSPAFSAKYLELSQEKMNAILQFTANQLADFKEHDNYSLSRAISLKK